jgi:hypothetical protein
VIAGFQLSAIKQQISIMDGALTETKRSGEQSTEQMWRAIDGIHWMAQSMDWSQKSTKLAMDNEVGKLNLQANALRESANQTSRLATATETANAHSIEFDRPWIGITILPQDFPNGKPPTFNIQVINSGRRPALVTLDASGTQALPTFPVGSPFPANDPRIAVSPSTELLVPGAHSESVINVSPAAVDADHLAAYDSGALSFFAFVDVEYEDVVTRTKHWTHHCIRYFPAVLDTKAGFYNCTVYNDVDQELAELPPRRK